jgi:ABC-type amino acid transport substrate-binding protein
VGCGGDGEDVVWRRVREQGVLRVGMEANWVPFEYVDGAGQLDGFDVELARALGERLGVQVQFFPTLSFDGLYDALTAGQVDVVISALVVDMSRSADFVFSAPYFDAGQVLVVGPDGADGSTGASSELSRGLARAVDEMQDLQGRALAVELGSDGDSVARRWARRLEGLTILHTDSAQAALEAVASGQVDAALTDRATALMELRDGRRTDDRYTGRMAGLYISGEPVTGEQYAVVALKGSGELMRALDDALEDMRRDGTLGELEGKWLGP